MKIIISPVSFYSFINHKWQITAGKMKPGLMNELKNDWVTHEIWL